MSPSVRLRRGFFLFIFFFFSISQSLKADSIWQEHFQASLLVTYSGFLNDDARGSAYFKLGYDQKWKYVRLKISTRYLTNVLALNYDVTEGGIPTGESTSLVTREQTDSYDRFFRETYIKFYLSEHVNLSIGKHIVTFGQFDFISPIDFILPFDVSDRSIKFTKQENRLPQTSLILSFFTKSQTEIEFIYFPTYESDSIISVFTSSPQMLVSNARYDKANQQVLIDRRPAFALPIFLEDQQQYALRIMQYDEEITYGFTFFLGPSQFPNSYRNILPDSDGDGLFLFNTAIRQDRGDTFGFELAKFVGDFEVKFEVAFSNFVYDDLGQFGDSSANVRYFVNDGAYYNSNDVFEGKGKEIVEYMNWIINNNGGKFYTDGSQYVIGLGFDYDTKNWFCNLTFLMFYRVINSRFEEAIDLRSKAFPSSGSPFGGVNLSSLLPLPTINFYRKYPYGVIEYQIGFGAGILGAGFGFSQYHIIKYKDDFKFIIALEALGLFSSFGARREAAAMLSNEEVDMTNPFVPDRIVSSVTESNGFVSPSIRIGISYIF